MKLENEKSEHCWTIEPGTGWQIFQYKPYKPEVLFVMLIRHAGNLHESRSGFVNVYSFWNFVRETIHKHEKPFVSEAHGPIHVNLL